MKHNQIVDTIYGPMIVNRHGSEFDAAAKYGEPVDNQSIQLYAGLIACCGPKPLIIDAGACFGAFTLGWARMLARLSPRIIAFEPQAWLFHCICGTLALNDIETAMVVNAAVGKECGTANVPILDYTREASFGSLGLMESGEKRWDYLKQEPDPGACRQVDMISIDSMGISPEAIKLDCEGMELDALLGAESTINTSRPLIFAEHVKGDRKVMKRWFFSHHYEIHYNQCDFVCIPVEKRDQFPPLEDQYMNSDVQKQFDDE